MMDGETREGLDQMPRSFRELGIGFRLDTESGVPFYRQIVQIVERNVGAGRLKPGDKLPTIRALAIALKINPNTIAKAYTELEIRGLVKTQVGSGTYVNDSQPDVAGEAERTRKRIEELCQDLLRQAQALGVDREEIISVLKELKDV